LETPQYYSRLKSRGYLEIYLNTYDEGQGYTEREHREWLKEAGFADFERKVLPDGFSFIRARKPK
jgi:ABC-type multidrug transport system ATPase subunit